MASDNLSFFTQRKHPQWGVVDVKTALTEATNKVQTEAQARQVVCQLDLPQTQLQTYGDANWISMALINLALNAIEHSPLAAGVTMAAKKMGQTICFKRHNVHRRCKKSN